MSRKFVLFLEDMRDASAKVMDFAEDLTFQSFAEHGMQYHAIVRLIEIIGEAAKNIPSEVRGAIRKLNGGEWAVLVT